MKINRNNYEIFFIDFYDGKLTDVQQLEMELFLESHPDLKIEFDEFENITVDAAKISFSQKRTLKKPEIVAVNGIDEENYEEAFIAFYENDLQADEKASLFSFLKANPYLEKEFQSHASLLLEKEDIVFEDKESLKKRAYVGYYWYGAAAVLLIFLALSFFLIQNRPAPSPVRYEIANIEPAAISNSINSNRSNQLIVRSWNDQVLQLPQPESFGEEKIHMLASVKPDIKLLQQNVPAYLIEWNFADETILLVQMEEPKKRGFLAQFFRKNVADVTESLGIENTLADQSVKKKKDPGFVKFLDGSLTVFNTITGSDAELVKNYDNEGNLRNYSLEGQSFVVNRKLPAGKSSD
jgi:tellurite resistance protein